MFKNALKIIFILSLAVVVACEKKVEEETPSTGGDSGGGGALSAPSKVEVPFNHDFKGSTTVTVNGVQANDLVKIFKDSSCSLEVGSAVSAGTSVDVSVTGLSQGKYSFYAKSVSSSGQVSSCSSAKADFEYLGGCPAGYVAVRGDQVRGVEPFCVMKFEAKNSSSTPVSVAAGAPWTNISANAAKSACQGLSGSSSGSYFDIISNKEWMALSDDIQSVNTNWYHPSDSSIHEVGNGVLNIGYSAAANDTNPAEVSDENDPITNVTSESNDVGSNGRAYYRTNVLTYGGTIWDVVGNAMEIVDYDIKTSFTSPPGCSQSGGPFSLDTGSGYCPSISSTEILPVDVSWASSSKQGVGLMDTTMVSDGTLLRGGWVSGKSRSGFNYWNASVNKPQDNNAAIIGFRCVQRFQIKTPNGLSVSRSKEVLGKVNVTVSGVELGNTVYLYKDEGCSSLASSQVAGGSSVVFNVTGLSTGTTKFYAKQKNANDVYSKCSTATTQFQYVPCPEGYLAIDVPLTSTRGVTPFCVMQFEAKNESSSPASKAAQAPWTGVSANEAKSLCRGLNTDINVSKFDLIANQEWMTIADNIGTVTYNFDNGSNTTGNVGKVNLGHHRTSNDNGPIAPAAVTDPSNEWTDVIDINGFSTSDFAYRRTHKLSTGDLLWDFSGNAMEIVDMGTASTYTSPPACNSGIPNMIVTVKMQEDNSYCPSLNNNEYKPTNLDINSFANVGNFYPGVEANKVLFRGGDNAYDGGNDVVGINSMTYSNIAPEDVNSSKVGFRCVYRP